MTTPLVLTFIGHDRPGLVSAISHRVAAAGGTWLESRLAHLAGKFAGILLVGVPEANVAAFTAALRDLEASGLRMTIERGAPTTERAGARIIELDLVGLERPGIVRDVTDALTQLGVNIEEFSSGVEPEPFTGAEMFRAAARLRIPDGLADDDLRKTLERLAGEMMVDLTMGERKKER